MKKKIIISVIISIVLMILLILLNTVLKDYIIIQNHYSTWRTFNIVSWVLFILSVIWCVFRVVRNLIIKHKNKLENIQDEIEIKERLEKRKKEINTPEGVYKYISTELIWDESISSKCRHLLQQLDEMNAAQARLDNLLDMNDMTGLEQSKIVLQRIEDDMCAECRTLINKYIVGGAKSFEEDYSKSYALNAERLEKVQALLNTMAEYANGKISGSDATAFLESYMSIIQDEMKVSKNQVLRL